MENISILNRKANFNSNSVQHVNSKNNIVVIGTDIERKISDPFVKLQSGDKSISNLSDLSEATIQVRREEQAKKRVLVKPENGGYILIGGLTCIGIITVGAIIFMAIKTLVIK